MTLTVDTCPYPGSPFLEKLNESHNGLSPKVRQTSTDYPIGLVAKNSLAIWKHWCICSLKFPFKEIRHFSMMTGHKLKQDQGRVTAFR